jgi:tRNA threonylcarbamoyl adenosine modification protein YeaZ
MQLFIETSSFYSSVAIFNEGSCLTYLQAQAPNSHAEILHVLIDNALKNNNLSVNNLKLLAMGGGPGSNTGLRIGLAALKGLGLVANLEPLAIDSHAAIAYSLNVMQSDSLVLSTSRKGLYNFTRFEGEIVADRGNTRNPSELARYLSSTCLVACPDHESAEILAEYQPEILLPNAQLLGKFHPFSQTNFRVELSSMM